MNGKKAKRIRKAVKLNQDLMETTKGSFHKKPNGQWIWDLKTHRGMIQQLKKVL